MTRIFLFLIVSTILSGCDQQLKNQVTELENRIANIENQLDEMISQNRPNNYLRVKQDSNVRTSPRLARTDNLLGRLGENSYVEKLEEKGEWLKVRIPFSNSSYEAYIHSNLVEEVTLGVKDFQRQAQFNHFFLMVSTSVKEQLKRHRIGLRGSGTLGLLINAPQNTKKELLDKVVHFFVNFDPQNFKVNIVESANFEKYSTIDCIAVVDISDDKKQLIKIVDRNSSIVFHQFVDFNIIE